jgi:hypothetical protein
LDRQRDTQGEERERERKRERESTTEVQSGLVETTPKN